VTTILVIEDTQPIQEFLEMALSDEGYQPISAYNGHEALAALSHHKVDLILLDLWMPKMDGKTFLTLYQKLPTLLAPIIVMSAYDDIVHDKALLGMVSECLNKPFDLNKMMASIKKQLSACG
jgi:DNA-binding response OmpR family regulator